MPVTDVKDQQRLVVYLDIDGVVHHHAASWHPERGFYFDRARVPSGHALFEWVSTLEDSLALYPDVRLVLSSAWCVHPGYAKTLKRFPESLRARFIGGTFHRGASRTGVRREGSISGNPRWQQIMGDVGRRRPLAWIAIDDDVYEWPDELRANLVACDGRLGLSDAATQQDLRSKLEYWCSAAGRTQFG